MMTKPKSQNQSIPSTAKQVEVCAGQVWKRNNDGLRTVVATVEAPSEARRAVTHYAVQTNRSTRTEYGPFLRKYTLVEDADAPEPWAGHPDVPVSEDELARLIAQDERAWR